MSLALPSFAVQTAIHLRSDSAALILSRGTNPRPKSLFDQNNMALTSCGLVATEVFGALFVLRACLPLRLPKDCK